MFGTTWPQFDKLVVMGTPERQGSTQCPRDAGPIPVVGEYQKKPHPLLRFYYCQYCSLLFAFTGGDDSPRGLVASFTINTKMVGGWELIERYGTDAQVRLAQTALKLR
jgi:hypothetical protein